MNFGKALNQQGRFCAFNNGIGYIMDNLPSIDNRHKISSNLQIYKVNSRNERRQLYNDDTRKYYETNNEKLPHGGWGKTDSFKERDLCF